MKNKNLLITGAATRVGKAIALHFAERGWNIALHYYRSSSKAKELKKIIEQNWVKVALIKADLKNPEQTEKIIYEASNGDAESQYKLFGYYIDGEEGFDENEHLAIDNLKKSADQNYMKAKFELAKCYRYGVGVEKNLETASELFESVYNEQPQLRKFAITT